MKVKCIFNKGENLPKEYIEPYAGYDLNTEFSLIKNKIYIVYGIMSFKSEIFYYICDEDYIYYPIGTPAPLFEIIDNQPSVYWIIDYCREKNYFEIVFKEWVQERYYYDELTEGDEKAVSIFRKYKKAIDAEANIKEDVQNAIHWLSKPLMMTDKEHGWHGGSQKEMLSILEQLNIDINKKILFYENIEYLNLLEKIKELGVDTGELYGLLGKISQQISDLKLAL